MSEATLYAQPAERTARRRPTIETVAFAAAVVIFFAVRALAIAKYPFDFDEVFSMRMARLGWGALFASAARDVSHPPLFYVLLKLWIELGGQSLAWVRVLPTAIGMLVIVPAVAAGQTLGLRTRELALAVLLFGVNGFLVFYAHHVRMFVLLELSSVVAVWRFARWLDTGLRRDLVWLTLANLFAIYSHYWGFVLLATEALVLLIAARRLIVPFLGSCAVLGLAYVPWAWAVCDAVLVRGTATAQIHWITVPSLADLEWFYVSLIGEVKNVRAMVGLAIFFGPLAWWIAAIARRGKRTDRRSAVVLVALAFIPVLLTFALSWMLPQSVWAPRQMIISAVPFLLLIGIATLRVPLRALRIALVVLQVLWSGAGGWAAMTKPNDKLAWDALAREMITRESVSTGTVPVYTFEIFTRDTLSFQLEDQRATRMPVVMVRSLDAMATAPRFWVVYRDTTWKGTVSPETWLRAHGFQVGIPKVIAMEGLQRITALPVRRTTEVR